MISRLASKSYYCSFNPKNGEDNWIICDFFNDRFTLDGLVKAMGGTISCKWQIMSSSLAMDIFQQRGRLGLDILTSSGYPIVRAVLLRSSRQPLDRKYLESKQNIPQTRTVPSERE